MKYIFIIIMYLARTYWPKSPFEYIYPKMLRLVPHLSSKLLVFVRSICCNILVFLNIVTHLVVSLCYPNFQPIKSTMCFIPHLIFKLKTFQSRIILDIHVELVVNQMYVPYYPHQILDEFNYHKLN